MIASGSPQQQRLRGWWPLIVAAAAYAVLIAVVVAVRTSGVSPDDDYATVREKTTSDFRDFWWTARHFRQTGQISTEYGVHNYLPFFTIFMQPWSLLPLPLAASLFSLLSLGLLGVAAVLVQSLLRDGVGQRPHAVMLIPLTLLLAYVHSCAVVGNVGLILVFLVVTTWFLVERGREWEAGVALGLATLIKLLPAVLILFFILKRRWRVAGSALGVAVLLGLGLPVLMVGQAETVEQHVAFAERAVAGHAAYRTIMSDKPAKAFYKNAGPPMVLRRLLSPVDAAASDDGPGLYVNVADVPRAVILAVYAVMLLALLGSSVWIALRAPPKWPPESVEAGRSLRSQFGAWCCLMLLASPLVWVHYLPLAYWPLACISDRISRGGRAAGRARWAEGAVLLLWLLGVAGLAWPAARAAGAQILPVLVLWSAESIASRPRR